MSAIGTLQAASVIAKTTQTAVGDVIGTTGYSYLTLFVSYVKGDETGVSIKVNFKHTASSTSMQEVEWTDTAGVLTVVPRSYKLTATGNVPIRIDVTGVDYVSVTQGGSNNDGTPTGTLAINYTLSEE